MYKPIMKYDPGISYIAGDPLYDGSGGGIGNMGRGGCPPEQQRGGRGRNPGKTLDNII